MDILKVKVNNEWVGIPAVTGERGIGIQSISKTATQGLVDTYTITFTDGITTTFELTNGTSPNLTVGTITEGPVAAASITGTAANPVLNLTLPSAHVPTRVSQLENDANYAVDANYVHTDNNYTTEEKEKLSGIAAGAEVNVNADWDAVDGDAQILNKPTNVSTFINDAGYLTTETDPTVPAWAKAAQKPSYTAAEVGAPTVAEMQQAIANINTMKIHICAQAEYDAETGIPTIQNPDTQTFYLVPGGEGSNLFIEWAYVNNNWERFGSADVEVPVQDVQVNGVSVLSNGVANVPMASASALGVVKPRNGFGINVDAAGQIYNVKPNDAEIKAGTHQYNSIVPYNQHASTFYGLAKAAGDSTQASSANAVGNYTDTAKEKIQSMLGVTQMLAPENPNLVAIQAYAIGDVFAANGHLYKATAAIAQDGTIIPDTNCVETTMADASGLKVVRLI